MMLWVLVLAGARQEGPCCDVLFSGFCGLVPVRVLGCPPFLGFAGSIFFLSFSVLVSFLYTSCMLAFYKISLLTYKKKCLGKRERRPRVSIVENHLHHKLHHLAAELLKRLIHAKVD